MTYGKKFLLGLLVASSWVLPGTMHAAADSALANKWSTGAAPSASTATDEATQLARQTATLAQQSGRFAFAAPTSPNSATIAPNGSTTINPAADNTSSAWKRTETTPAADIRFKKPSTAIVTDQGAQPVEQVVKKPAIQQQQVAALAAAVPAPATTVATAPVVAAPASAVSTALYAPSAQAAGGPNMDNQVQLVSRILDADVRHAAEDEPLPAVPQDVRTNGNNGMNGNNGNNGNRQTNNNDGNKNNMYAGEGAICDTGCCEPQPCLFWTAGVEATFLNPDLNSGGVSFEVEQIDEERYDLCSSESDSVDSLYMSPRIWLGVQGCCWGANLRYWHLQASEGGYDPSIGGFGLWDGYDCGRPDLGYFTCSRLEAYTVDLELTRRFCLNDCQMQAAVGLRHAELEASEGITGLAVTDEGILSGFARANQLSRGTGFLLGLYGRKPLYPCSCVNWFYNARWSALWGPTQTAAETFAAVQASDTDFTATAGSVNGAYTNIDDTMFIGEIQLGLEWNYALRCLPANAFFRAAVEYQRWDGGSGNSNANSFAGITVVQQVDPTSIVSTQASGLAPQLDLLGFTLGTGLTW